MAARTFDDLHASMPWDAIDAAVFDVGNVLVRFDPAALLRRHLPDFEPMWPLLTERVFRSPYWAMMDRGTVTLAEAAELMAGPDEALREPVGRLMRDWPDLWETVPEGVAALAACRARGKRTYVPSNYNHEAFPVVRDRYDFFRGFDGMAVSGFLHICKPDPAIYRRLTDTYGLDPARLLFIDDSPVNVEAALHLGWNALCLDRPGKLAAFFGLGDGAEFAECSQL